MTIQQLKYLIEVAKCGSISKAAQNLFVTQPSVSNALNNLA
ncbi:LysR family transcriptional regulator [Akkermansia muciniphila]|nr:LysR family transcriptional regulator [Akkermansia muciniphila]